jgi:hypothetical protein
LLQQLGSGAGNGERAEVSHACDQKWHAQIDSCITVNNPPNNAPPIAAPAVLVLQDGVRVELEEQVPMHEYALRVPL